jgi:hypothetical protein
MTPLAPDGCNNSLGNGRMLSQVGAHALDHGAGRRIPERTGLHDRRPIDRHAQLTQSPFQTGDTHARFPIELRRHPGGD